VVLCADLVGADHIPHTSGRLWAWPIIGDFRWFGSAVNWAVAHQVTSFSFLFSYFFVFLFIVLFLKTNILQVFLYF
jgi:hypothetical protein